MAADFDLITVGGGLGGAALGRALALAGRSVLIIEQEERFRDRVRGEQVSCWGVAEAEALGIAGRLRDACAHDAPFFDAYIGPILTGHRDLRETTPQQCANLTFYHPRMQETLLEEARAAGASVMRGASVRDVRPGAEPAVTVADDGREERFTARIVAGCDGRNSSVRKWGGFDVQRDRERMQIAGLFVEDVQAPDDTLILAFDVGAGACGIVFPQGEGRARTYYVNRVGDRRFSGDKDVPAYFETMAKCVPEGASVLRGARAAGPLATFDGADNFVRSPYRDGVALVGDAAATSDPAWGQGLSLTLRDARTLRDSLLATEDWAAAGAAYAAEHDRGYDAVRTAEDWFTELFYAAGPEADARRGRAFGGLVADPTRAPDTLQSGPDAAVLDDAARRRFYGED